MTSSPVLLIAFNRPDTTRQVFEVVRAARPARLFVAVDGPRADRPDDRQKVEAVRQLLSAVDWPCELATCFRDENLGCGKGPAAAIDWFFEHEEEGIILEDDCLPHASFFPYCDILLERYRHADNVAQVCGSSFIDLPADAPSYYFTKYADIWGWATWRRSWQTADLAMFEWPEWRDAGGLQRLCGSSPGFVAYWTHIFDAMYAEEIVHTWDYQWLFSCWRRGAISIGPKVPLVRNLGFGADATHHLHGEVPSYVRSASDIGLPLTDPVSSNLDPALERAIARNRYFIDISTDLAALATRVPFVGRPCVKRIKQLRNALGGE